MSHCHSFPGPPRTITPSPRSCRHTYASFLVAAGYTLKEIMEHMGQAGLQMVQRHTKLLPQPDEHDPAERLDAYLRKRFGNSA